MAAKDPLVAEWRPKLAQLESRTPQQQSIRLQRIPSEPQVALLTIESGSRNALSGQMMSQLVGAVEQLRGWCSETVAATVAETAAATPPAALLLVGANGSFCSGSDLVTVRDGLAKYGHQSGHGYAIAKLMQSCLEAFRRLPLLSVAWLEGYALGGGAELAMAADLRLVSANAQIGFVHAKLGVTCGWCGSVNLVEAVGRSRALELMTSGRLVGAEEALDLGLAQGRAQRLEDALEFVRGHLLPGELMGSVKALVNYGDAPRDRCGQLQLELATFDRNWGSPDHLAALQAKVKHNNNNKKSAAQPAAGRAV